MNIKYFILNKQSKAQRNAEKILMWNKIRITNVAPGESLGVPSPEDASLLMQINIGWV